MEKNLRFLVALAVLLAVAIGGPWRAHAQQSMPGVKAPAPSQAETSVEGTVKKVNPAERTIEVSTGLLGLWGKTLEVTDGTQIQDQGRQATLADIHEGAKVKASYETRSGKSIATRIDLVPPPMTKESPGPPRPRVQ
jgi:Cu/Ag efflux protein CusF